MEVRRLRRLRQKPNLRNWVSETDVSPRSIILPYFVVEGKKVRKEIKSMPGVYHLSIDNLLKDIPEAYGIESILLFGIPGTKDEKGTSAYKKNGIVQRAIKAIKREYGDLIVITDVCLCGYTSHGHCGIIKTQRPTKAGTPKRKTQNCTIDNDETIKVLVEIALSHAEAGADFVAPSAMMDGQVGAIRKVLDKEGFNDTGILAYSAKYASNFYGPFREALDSAPQFGDRKTYQMDFRNSNEALREIKQDIDEGADIVMVKPSLAYLDIIHRVKENFQIPVAAYNVSGEYSIIKAYCEKVKDIAERKKLEREIALEILFAIKRAGADFIITYYAKEVLRWLR